MDCHLDDQQRDSGNRKNGIMAISLEHKIIGLCGLGTSLRDISARIKETKYGYLPYYL